MAAVMDGARWQVAMQWRWPLALQRWRMTAMAVAANGELDDRGDINLMEPGGGQLRLVE